MQHTAQDELFAAIEGTALHTRVILDRMEEHGVHVRRVINAGGIPQKNEVLNQVYANVFGRPVLVPSSNVVGVGSAIFAFLAAGTCKTVEEAQAKICPSHKTYNPDPAAQAMYDEIYPPYRQLYFEFGEATKGSMGSILPTLIRVADKANAVGTTQSSQRTASHS